MARRRRSRPTTREYKWEDFPVNRRRRLMRDGSPDDRDPKYRRPLFPVEVAPGGPSMIVRPKRPSATSVKTAFRRKFGDRQEWNPMNGLGSHNRFRRGVYR